MSAPHLREILPLFLTAMMAVPARAQEVIVRTVEQNTLAGQLVEFTEARGLTLRLDGGAETTVPLFDVVRIAVRFEGSIRAGGPWEIRLVNDDLLQGQWRGAEGESVTFDAADVGEITIPVDSVSRMVHTLAVRSHADAVRTFLAAPSRGDDCVLLTNGDALCGFLVKAEREALRLESRGETVRIPIRSIVAVRFSTQDVSPPTGVTCLARLRSGGRVTLSHFRWKGEVIEAELLPNVPIKLPSARVESLAVSGGRWTRLSSLTPLRHEYEPLFSLTWNYQRDRNVLGGRLRVGGEAYDEGIGVHSRSTLTYNLEGKYRDFVTSFGIDDDSGPHADVTVRVLVDGALRFEQTNVRRGTLFGPVRISTAGADRLDLVVDFGANGDLHDRLNWIEPALIR